MPELIIGTDVEGSVEVVPGVWRLFVGLDERCSPCGGKTRARRALWQFPEPVGLVILCYLCAIQLVAVAAGYVPEPIDA